MSWQIIVALIIIVPLILIPVALIWFLNFGGMRIVLKEVSEKQIAQKESVSTAKTE